jgi:hypothetical protein
MLRAWSKIFKNRDRVKNVMNFQKMKRAVPGE